MKIKPNSRKKLKNNLRWQALVLLDKIENNQEFSNIVINEFLSGSDFDERDNRLLVQIVYGVVQRRYTLDYYLKPFTKGKKIDKWIQSLLRMSIYQLVFLDRVPDYAVVNEAVLIAKTNGHRQLGNFVNAILRQFMRAPLPDLSAIKNDINRLSIQYSIDEWIVDYLAHDMALNELEELLASIIEEPYISARVNTTLISRDEVMERLEKEGSKTVKSELSPEGIRLLEGSLVSSAVFKEGLITIQDESSMLVAPLGKIKGNERILDACSAPGGKATHMASRLTTGHLTALDISEDKLNLVRDHLERMGLSESATLIPIDATKYQPREDSMYDIIYLDAPCSGLGLIRRKPEIKYNKSTQDVDNLADIQKKLISHVSRFLKPGGRLIYSTCTITKDENEELIDWFLTTHTGFSHDKITVQDGVPADIITDRGEVRILPHYYHTDGFFISRLIKEIP